MLEALAGGEQAAGHAEVDFGPGDAAGQEVVQAPGVNAARRTRCSTWGSARGHRLVGLE